MPDLSAKPNKGARRTAADRREAILKAARSLFARQGFHGTGMAEIARVSEVLVGQIYRDFARKEDLIAALVERDVTQMLGNPDIARAISTGDVNQLNNWVRRFIGHKFDDETRNVMADIISEAGRNPRIAAIVTAAHNRLLDRVASAAALWAPQPDKEAARRQTAELILTMAGAMQQRQFLGLEWDPMTMKRMLDLVDVQIAELGAHA